MPRAGTVEAVELPSSAAPFAGLVSACVEERLEGLSELGIHRFDAQDHVDVPGRPEIETRRVEQKIASGTADDGVLALVGREVFAEPVDSGHHGIASSSRSAAEETRSSR